MGDTVRMKYQWPLNDNHFTAKERSDIAEFILNSDNRWTSDKRVIELEALWAKLTGYKYVIMTSSGSTAIELLVRTYKTLYGVGSVVLPVLTWSTSVTPWIHNGFNPIFVDVDLGTMCMSPQKVWEVCCIQRAKVVFPTAVFGSRNPSYGLAEYGEHCAVDNCESAFNLPECSHTSVTSLYFGHQFTTGTEGGLLFTNNPDERDVAVLLRGHGLTSELSKYTGQVLERFVFTQLGSNFRSNDLAAFMGLIDSRKFQDKKEHRELLYRQFCDGIHEAYRTFDLNGAFAIPIVTDAIPPKQLMYLLEINGVETRPIISGNLLKQPAFADYHDGTEFPNADFLTQNGLYVGLHEGVTTEQIAQLVSLLNSLV